PERPLDRRQKPTNPLGVGAQIAFPHAALRAHPDQTPTLVVADLDPDVVDELEQRRHRLCIDPAGLHIDHDVAPFLLVARELLDDLEPRLGVPIALLRHAVWPRRAIAGGDTVLGEHCSQRHSKPPTWTDDRFAISWGRCQPPQGSSAVAVFLDGAVASRAGCAA